MSQRQAPTDCPFDSHLLTRTGPVTARMLNPTLEEPSLTKLLLTPEEAAQVLGIGRTKVYELMLSNALESVKIGASRRIPSESLTSFVDGLRAQGA